MSAVWILAFVIIAMFVLAFVTFAVIVAKNMTFDDVVDDVTDTTKITVNQSSRVVGQILEGGA